MASLDEKSKSIRKKILKMVEVAQRGHLSSAFSLVEILRVLYDDVLKYDPKKPRWSGRDRFILSKGHGCLALYVILEEKGFFPESELWKFCRIDGMLGGHPEISVPGIEASTGSLGHGLSIGIGIALAAKIDKKDYRTFVVIGDGESNEGSIWEGALCASKHKLSNLTVLIDYNKKQSYSCTSDVLELEPYADKWRSFGFEVTEVDGHDICQIKNELNRIPFNKDKPSMIICHTLKGKGSKTMENSLEWHHVNKVSDEVMKKIVEEVGSYR